MIQPGFRLIYFFPAFAITPDTTVLLNQVKQDRWYAADLEIDPILESYTQFSFFCHNTSMDRIEDFEAKIKNTFHQIELKFMIRLRDIVENIKQFPDCIDYRNQLCDETVFNFLEKGLEQDGCIISRIIETGFELIGKQGEVFYRDWDSFLKLIEAQFEFCRRLSA